MTNNPLDKPTEREMEKMHFNKFHGEKGEIIKMPIKFIESLEHTLESYLPLTWRI